MNQSAVYPHAQLVVCGIRVVSRFHAIPGIRRQLRAAVPLRHFGRDIVGVTLVGTQHTFNLSYPNFVISIGRTLDPHNMFMVIARLIAHRLAEVHIGAHVQALDPGRQCANNLRWIGAATEVHRVATIVGFGVIHQGIVARTQAVVIAVKNPADKGTPAIGRSTHSAAFKIIAKKYTGRHR